MSSYFRPSLDAVAGYVPGEQPKPGTALIKLNTNENPYPPSPAAIETLRTLDSEWLRRYPDAILMPMPTSFASPSAMSCKCLWIGSLQAMVAMNC